jgi:hypothetical protein
MLPGKPRQALRWHVDAALSCYRMSEASMMWRIVIYKIAQGRGNLISSIKIMVRI